jgi:hypothetical protein
VFEADEAGGGGDAGTRTGTEEEIQEESEGQEMNTPVCLQAGQILISKHTKYEWFVNGFSVVAQVVELRLVLRDAESRELNRILVSLNELERDFEVTERQVARNIQALEAMTDAELDRIGLVRKPQAAPRCCPDPLPASLSITMGFAPTDTADPVDVAKRFVHWAGPATGGIESDAGLCACARRVREYIATTSTDHVTCPECLEVIKRAQEMRARKANDYPPRPTSAGESVRCWAVSNSLADSSRFKSPTLCNRAQHVCVLADTRAEVTCPECVAEMEKAIIAERQQAVTELWDEQGIPRAPKGGITIDGTYYAEGQFMPVSALKTLEREGAILHSTEGVGLDTTVVSREQQAALKEEVENPLKKRRQWAWEPGE